MKRTLYIYAHALRVNQWIKNFVIFTAVLFAGEIFNGAIFLKTATAFLIFCLLSSTSYVLNDIIDYQYDIKHPTKKHRPIAAGLISIQQATFIVFLLSVSSLIASLLFSVNFFFLSLVFLILHFYYSLYLKKYPVIDIFTISLSFVLRTVAGVVATGFHIPVWLLMTIFFISLFMASVKRHAELVTQGKDTRESLYRYKGHMLYFLATTFATLTIVSYALYTYTLYIDPTQQSSFESKSICTQLYQKQKDIKNCEDQNIISGLTDRFTDVEARKLMMLTIPFVVYGISRYAQLLYEKEEGERPEKIITTDKPLLITIFLWSLTIFALIYVF
jgi:decaprenyl-phosphate phosphoribosyltransferase